MRLHVLALCLLLASACHTQQAPFTISFGAGGGFTGNVIMYQVAQDGKLTKTESLTKKSTEIGVIPKKDLKKLLQMVETNKLVSIPSINQSGNMSNYLSINMGTLDSKHIWTGAKSGNGMIDSLFQMLNTIAATQESKIKQ